MRNIGYRTFHLTVLLRYLQIYRTTWWTKDQFIKEFEPELRGENKEETSEQKQTEIEENRGAAEDKEGDNHEHYDKARVDSVLVSYFYNFYKLEILKMMALCKLHAFVSTHEKKLINWL